MGDVPKLKRDGKVAVIYSPGFGAGWSTWADGNAEAVLFDPELAEMLEARGKMARGSTEFNLATQALCRFAEKKYPGVYTGGLSKAGVAWLPEGTAFYVHEYDGSESIKTSDSDNWKVA